MIQRIKLSPKIQQKTDDPKALHQRVEPLRQGARKQLNVRDLRLLEQLVEQHVDQIEAILSEEEDLVLRAEMRDHKRLRRILRECIEQETAAD
jgi:hypothetical protein